MGRNLGCYLRVTGVLPVSTDGHGELSHGSNGMAAQTFSRITIHIDPSFTLKSSNFPCHRDSACTMLPRFGRKVWRYNCDVVRNQSREGYFAHDSL